MFKNRKLALLLAFVIVFSLMPSATASGASQHQLPSAGAPMLATFAISSNQLIGNEHIAFSVNPDGAYSVGFTNGDINDTSIHQHVLYNYPYAQMAQTAIRIDNTNYVFYASSTDVDADNLKAVSTMTIYPTTTSGAAISISYDVTQTIQIVNNPDTNKLDTVQINYDILNNAGTSVSADVRVMLDPSVGGTLALPISLPNSETFTASKEFTGSSVPESWKITNADSTPPVTAKYILHKSNDLTPSRLQFANWNLFYSSFMNTSDWYFPFNEGDTWNDDCATILYWDSVPLSTTAAASGPVSIYITNGGTSSSTPTPTPAPTSTPQETPRPTQSQAIPHSQKENADTATQPTAAPTTAPTTEPTAAPVPDETANNPLMPENLGPVLDAQDAVKVVDKAINFYLDGNSYSDIGDDYLVLFAEEAISRAASQLVDGDIVQLDSSSISSLQDAALSLYDQMVGTFDNSDLDMNRPLKSSIMFLTSESDHISIVIDPTTFNMEVDYILIRTPEYDIILYTDFIKDNLGTTPLEITIELTNGASNNTAGNAKSPYAFIADDNAKSISVNFNRKLSTPMTLSVKPNEKDDLSLQTFVDSSDTPIGGNYNPVSDMLVCKIADSGTYTVKTNQVDFSDILIKSQEMQEAIKSLASKGIINGTTQTTYSPDSPVTRAEIATFIVRILNKYDPNMDGGFTDVSLNDWYYGAIGSVKNEGLMVGMEPNRFYPELNIPKDQIITLTSRVLQKTMGYYAPKNVDEYLSNYADADKLPDWSRQEIAMATRENIVASRKDGLFEPTSVMTRGDVAVIFYRMFKKIW